MNTGVQVFRRSTLIVFLVAGPLAPRLSAGSVIAYNFSGVIESVSTLATQKTGVVVGDTITGTFTYDSTQAGNPTTGLFTFTGSSKVHTMTFKIYNSMGQQVFTDSYSGNHSAYYAAQVGFNSSVGGSGRAAETLDLMGDTIYKQGLGITGPGPPPAFDLSLYNPNVTTRPNSFPLPTPTTITSFVASNQQTPFTPELNWDPAGQYFTASISQFSQAPEPSSLILGTVAMVMCAVGCLIARRQLATTRYPLGPRGSSRITEIAAPLPSWDRTTSLAANRARR